MTTASTPHPTGTAPPHPPPLYHPPCTAPQVLAEFPMELLSAVVAGRWAAAAHPFTPWLAAYRVRLALAATRWAGGCCILLAACCLLHTARCLLLAARCSLRAACWRWGARVGALSPVCLCVPSARPPSAGVASLPPAVPPPTTLPPSPRTASVPQHLRGVPLPRRRRGPGRRARRLCRRGCNRRRHLLLLHPHVHRPGLVFQQVGRWRRAKGRVWYKGLGWRDASVCIGPHAVMPLPTK